MKYRALTNSTTLPRSSTMPRELSCETALDVNSSLDALAQTDYVNHPAYGGAFPPATLGLRARAIAKLLPWLGFALAKQLLLGDRISSLPNESEGLDGGILQRIGAVPRYLPLIVGSIA